MNVSDDITPFEFVNRVRARAIQLGDGARPKLFATDRDNLVTTAMLEVDRGLVEFVNTPPKRGKAQV